LPIQVDLERSPTPRLDLHDYLAVDGILVPERVVVHSFNGKPFVVRQRVLVNVEHDAGIFECTAESLVLPGSWQR